MAADDKCEEPSAPWHHSTANVVGASAAALAVLALVVWGASALGGSDAPQDAPTNFVSPTYSSTTSTPSTSTTGSTLTTTQTPVTSEIAGPPDTSPSGTTSETSPSESTTSTTTSTWTSHELPTTRTRAPESGDESSTSRSRPRQNVTRTLYPGPGA